MSDLSARLGLPLLKPSQAQKHVTHNEALQLLDALVQAVVEETGAETPPFAPVDGQVFALGANPSGEWAGEGGNLALRAVGAWLFLTPRAGWRVWDKASGVYKVFDGTGWVSVRIDIDNLDGVGIKATHDATNRLSVSSPAVLFNHEGAGHQIKVNKAAAGDTASLLFQSGFTGHAEMGLAGVNDWSIKVSPDGIVWTDAFVIDRTTGHASGAAVQSIPTDTTAGRLARADYAYGPGNLLGTVSQSGGTPTGAVIERGSNADGEYVRFADGTQICTIKRLTLTQNSTASCKAVWTYPAAFVDATVAVQFTPIPGTDAESVINFDNDATPNHTEIMGPRCGNLSASSVSVAMYRISGMTDFAAGDQLYVSGLAFGRWF